MQRKLIALLCCQLLEPEGRLRLLKAARCLAERALAELLLLHQNPSHLSSNLWSAVRARGCQFLGPGAGRIQFFHSAASRRQLTKFPLCFSDAGRGSATDFVDAGRRGDDLEEDVGDVYRADARGRLSTGVEDQRRTRCPAALQSQLLQCTFCCFLPS